MITAKELRLIVEALEHAFIPLLENKIERDVKGAVHQEAMKIVYEMANQEVAKKIRDAVKDKLLVEVKVGVK